MVSFSLVFDNGNKKMEMEKEGKLFLSLTSRTWFTAGHK